MEIGFELTELCSLQVNEMQTTFDTVIGIQPKYVHSIDNKDDMWPVNEDIILALFNYSDRFPYNIHFF